MIVILEAYNRHGYVLLFMYKGMYIEKYIMIIEDEEAMQMSFGENFTIITGEFPVTNHNDVDEGNLGWIKGVFDDGTPFEAELWVYEGNSSVSVLVPATNYEIVQSETDKNEGNVIPFQVSREYVHGGVLSVGMMSLGYETDNEIIHHWVDYLEEKGFIDFAGEWRNGSVQYVVDVNGNTFCEIIVGLEDEEMFYGEVDFEWNEFSTQKPISKGKLTIIR